MDKSVKLIGTRKQEVEVEVSMSSIFSVLKKHFFKNITFLDFNNLYLGEDGFWWIVRVARNAAFSEQKLRKFSEQEKEIFEALILLEKYFCNEKEVKEETKFEEK